MKIIVHSARLSAKSHQVLRFARLLNIGVDGLKYLIDSIVFLRIVNISFCTKQFYKQFILSDDYDIKIQSNLQENLYKQYLLKYTDVC